MKAARSAGFANLSIDLMYGLPDQTLVEWQATLEQALDLEPEHLSTYCLTLEPGTPMHRRVELGQVADPDPDLAADMYEHIESVMEAAGYRHYEISNWALPGAREPPQPDLLAQPALSGRWAGRALVHRCL